MGCSGTKSNNDNSINVKKRDKFIKDFFNKSLESSVEKITFIKIKKKMKISNNFIDIEEEDIITVKTEEPSTYSDYYWFVMDCEVNKLETKEIYIDDKKVDDSNFKIKDDYYIKIEYEKIYSGQIRKIKVIQKIEKSFIHYCSHTLILNRDKDVFVRFVIYGDDVIIDDITNKNYIFNNELNLAYFEGITNEDTILEHGYINY